MKQTTTGPILNNELAVPIGIYLTDPKNIDTVIQLNTIRKSNNLNAII